MRRVPTRQGVHFAAAFILGEFHEEPGNIHHAGIFIHDDQTTGSHHGAGRRQGFIINGQIKVGSRQASAHRATGLYGLESFVVLYSTANIDRQYRGG